MEMREMIERATDKERKQLKAVANDKLNSLRKRRKRTLEPDVGEDHEHHCCI
jgi:hypothetical protein